MSYEEKQFLEIAELQLVLKCIYKLLMKQQKRGYDDSFQSKVVVYGIGEFIIKKKEEDHKKICSNQIW